MLHDGGNLRVGRDVSTSYWQSGSAITCPRCGKDDQLQRVSTIVDSGTSQTNGVGVGAVVAGAGGRHPVAVAGYTAENKSNLAGRLSGPREPRFGIIKSFLMAWIPLTIVVLFYFRSVDSQSNILWTIVISGFVAFWVSLIPTLLIYFIGDLTLIKKRAQWRKNLAHLREAYYCHRDDLVIATDGLGTPEEYAAWCFSRP
jgi:hypothetical protein